MTVTPTERPAWAASFVKLSRRPRVWPAASLALVAVLVLASATASLARPAGTVSAARSGLAAGAQPANPLAQTVEFTFTSTFDGSTQQAVMQVPTAYQAGQAAPLLIALHDWEEDRLPPFNDFKTAADNAGWLLASPNMHGNVSPGPAHALASLASQHDILDTIQWVSQHYTIDPSRIYITGKGMGGQTALVTAAKHPGTFAAVASDRGFTSLVFWWDDGSADRRAKIEQEVGGNPDVAQWEYQRRSMLREYVDTFNYVTNYELIPLRLYAASEDTFVPLYHAVNLNTSILAAYPTAPVTLTTFPGDHATPVPGGPAGIIQWLGTHVRGAPPTQFNAVTDENTTLWWVNVTQRTNVERFTQVRTVIGSNNTVVMNVVDEEGVDLSLDLAAAGLPAAERYAVEDVDVDQATFGNRSVDPVAGSLPIGVDAGSHRVTTYPGLTPLPMATVELQYGVNGFSGASDTYLSQWNPGANYGVAPQISLRSPNVFNGLLRFNLASVPSQALIGGIHGAALSLQLLADGNGNESYVHGYKLNRSWNEAQATWTEATSGQPWGGPGANAVPADREGRPLDSRESWA